VLAVFEPGFDSFAVRQAVAGLLAGYGESTRSAYSLDLRQWIGWCESHDLGVFDVQRAHIELFARSLEQAGRARATVARRLSTITGFYRYCVEEELLKAHLLLMCGGRDSTTNRTPSVWTATSLASSSSRPDSLRDETTRWRVCSP
jgi:site-specific recombinase XerD